MKVNLNVIAFDDDSITNGDVERIDSNGFVPLADVADLVWRRPNERPKDEANHFADMDQEGEGNFKDRTLFALIEEDRDNNLSISIWNEFYDSINTDTSHRGALPFRIWQIYNEMVRFLKAGEIEKFVCAAGIVSHYIGDASQPLHTSKYHHGHPGNHSEIVFIVYTKQI